MFSDIVGILGGFHNFILCLVIGLVLIIAITLIGFSLFRLENPFLGWYALFLNGKRRHLFVIAVGFLRMFYAVSMIWLTKSFHLTHCLVYVLFALLMWCVAARPWYIFYDAVYSTGMFGICYMLYLVHKELRKVQVQGGMGILVVVFAVLLLAAAVGQFFISMNTIATKSEVKTAGDKKIRRFSYLMLPGVFLALILPYFILTHVSSISLQKGGIQFVNGEKISVEAGSKLTLTEKGCMVSFEDTSYLLAGSPIYDKEDGSVIFTEYCSIVRPKIQMTNRVNPMSKLKKTENGFFVSDGEKNSAVENFFLFDGLDTYYFPETTTLVWEGEQIELSAFSKVEVLYNQKIEIFDYENERYSSYDGIGGMCIATLAGNEKINLSTDILYRENGEEQMLFLQPMLLSDLE